MAKERCYICGKKSLFTIRDQATLLRDAICENCGSSLRNSGVAKYVVKYTNHKNMNLKKADFSNCKILNTCSSGIIHDTLNDMFKKGKVGSYICSEYFEKIPSGEVNDKGIMCVDLTNIPFEDESLDVIISEDVFEHILNWEIGFEQIYRKLKKGGVHVFTVPVHEWGKTVSRVDNPLKIYHGDPIRSEGTLVITDFGNDLVPILRKKGMFTRRYVTHRFYKKTEITNCDDTYEEYLQKKTELDCYFKYNSIIFVTLKK